MNTHDQDFLTNPNLSLWVCGLYVQALQRDPVDAANDADALAQALSDRMLAICLKEPIPSTISQMVDDRATSMWLLHALMQSLQRDPVQASAEAELLAVALDARIQRQSKLTYTHAMEYLRPRLQKELLQHEVKPVTRPAQPANSSFGDRAALAY